MTRKERDKRFPMGIYSNQWLEERERQKQYFLENHEGILFEESVYSNMRNLILGYGGAHTENGLDPGIQPWVAYLNMHGAETVQSCEGGEGHGHYEPTIWMQDELSAWKAYALCRNANLPLATISQCWDVFRRDIEGVTWKLEFYRKADERDYPCLVGSPPKRI